MSSAETIRVGHGGTILLQLQAENMETGITAPLPESVMGTISRVVLVLSNTVKIDSAVDGVGLGQGLPFDHTINPLAAKLAITVGDLAQMIGLGGNYPRPHLDVYFGGTTPIEFAAMPIKVFPAS